MLSILALNDSLHRTRGDSLVTVVAMLGDVLDFVSAPGDLTTRGWHVHGERMTFEGTVPAYNGHFDVVGGDLTGSSWDCGSDALCILMTPPIRSS